MCSVWLTCARRAASFSSNLSVTSTYVLGVGEPDIHSSVTCHSSRPSSVMSVGWANWLRASG